MKRVCSTSAYTLVELLVVVALIAVLAVWLPGGLAGGSRAAALSSAQASVAGLVSAARLQATASGRKTRLLVHNDPMAPTRYLREIVWQRARQAGAAPADWDTVESLALPAGCYVVPGSLLQAGGLVADAAEWRRRSQPTQSLVSDLFANQALRLTLDGESEAQSWTGVAFTAQGTLAAVNGGPPPTGAWLLALGAPRPPADVLAGESPVRLGSSRAVRGLLLSAYGVATLFDDPDAL